MELYNLYLKYKEHNSLADMSDILDISLKNIDNYLEKFDKIFVDQFNVGSLNLLKNKKESHLYEIILNNISSEQLEKEESNKSINLYQNNAFNAYDETREAIKIAKKLMLDGNTEEDIVIVTSNFPKYAPYFHNLLAEYDMKGYDTIGRSLSTISLKENDLKYHSNFKVQKSYWNFNTKYNETKSYLEHLSLVYDDKYLKENLLLNTKVRGNREGILFADMNNLLGIDNSIKHIILVGSDSTMFPPKSRDNFLFSQEQSQKLFNTNNIYEASKTLYNELKRLSDKLYVVTALYQDKRKLSTSIIIDKDINNVFNVNNIQSRNDILKDKNMIDEPELNEFQSSVSSNEFTKYDGEGIGVFNTGDKLSASALNSYEKCPLQYYFSSVLKLNAPQDDRDGFDAAQKGSLMHKCFELFTIDIQQKDATNMSKDELYSFMYDISQKAYDDKETQGNIGIGKENINHKIELEIFRKGLNDIHSTDKSELAKFVDYFYENKFEYFKHTNSEELFMLDSDFNVIDLDGKTDEEIDHISKLERFIKGYIDRLDNLNEDVNIIDYKSSVKSKNIKDLQKESLKDYQLGLYMLYATQQYPNKNHNAHLLSFKESDKPTTQEYNTSISIPYSKRGVDIEFDNNYKETLKNQIITIKDNINNGKFAFNNSDEKNCEYCNFSRICHQLALNKEISDV